MEAMNRGNDALPKRGKGGGEGGGGGREKFRFFPDPGGVDSEREKRLEQGKGARPEGWG